MTSILQKKDRRYLWHPYTQMKDYAERDILMIDRAEGLFLYDETGRRYYDTISSWWCIVHGHNHPIIKNSVKAQLDKLEQVLLAGTCHEPAVLLAEKIVGLLPLSLEKVFYSDNGSTACEVAIKMSIQYWRHRGHPDRKEIVSLERGYHGDTIGTMSLGGVPEFHGAFDGLLFRSHRLPSPYCYRCSMAKQNNECSLECLTPFKKLIATRGDRIAALILEPLIQAAGGMIVYPIRYLKEIAKLCKNSGIHLILDEVATGFGRTGKMFAMDHAEIEPDFVCLSKGLTGGCLPMAATVTTNEIYQAFYADYIENKTFYHGHTFTGNPLAAAAALGSLQVFEQESTLDHTGSIIPYFHEQMERFRDLAWLGDLRQIGMISALELVKDQQSKEPFPFSDRVGWKIYLEGLKNQVILRPLGNVVYLWLPLSATKENIIDIIDRVWKVLSNKKNIAGLG